MYYSFTVSESISNSNYNIWQLELFTCWKNNQDSHGIFHIVMTLFFLMCFQYILNWLFFPMKTVWWFIYFSYRTLCGIDTAAKASSYKEKTSATVFPLWKKQFYWIKNDESIL